MVFINLIHQLPILEDNPVRKNQISLALGLVLYVAIGIAIYTDRIPPNWLSAVPDKRYLFLVVGIDLALFFFLYRFQHGEFPKLSGDVSDKGISNKKIKHKNRKQVKFSEPENIEYKSKQKPYYSRSQISPVLNTSESFVDTETEIDNDIDNDLESTFKKPGLHKQSELPDEVSIPGGNYFRGDERPKIENWEMDEYTHEEYVPDDENMDMPNDESIIE